MNQRNAIPVNGIRFRATRTQSRKRASASHSPGSVGSAVTASRMSTRLRIYNTEKVMPLMATPGGGAGGCGDSVGTLSIAYSESVPPIVGSETHHAEHIVVLCCGCVNEQGSIAEVFKHSAQAEASRIVCKCDWP